MRTITPQIFPEVAHIEAGETVGVVAPCVVKMFRGESTVESGIVTKPSGTLFITGVAGHTFLVRKGFE